MTVATAMHMPSLDRDRIVTGGGARANREKALDLTEIIGSIALVFPGQRTSTTAVIIGLEAEEDVVPFFAPAVQPAKAPTVVDQLEQLKRIAALTDEEVAALLGTTRQTLHNWRSGRNISARREQRLEKTLEVIQSIGAGDAEENRRVLMVAHKGQVRIFDLLSEGSIDSALAAIGGEPMQRRLLQEGYSLTTGMGLVEDRAPESKPKIDRRFSKSL